MTISISFYRLGWKQFPLLILQVLKLLELCHIRLYFFCKKNHFFRIYSLLFRIGSFINSSLSCRILTNVFKSTHIMYKITLGLWGGGGGQAINLSAFRPVWCGSKGLSTHCSLAGPRWIQISPGHRLSLSLQKWSETIITKYGLSCKTSIRESTEYFCSHSISIFHDLVHFVEAKKHTTKRWLSEGEWEEISSDQH